MKTTIMTIIISVLLLSDHVVLGQEGEWTVVTANGDVLVNLAFTNFVNDTLRFSQTGQNFTIPIESIVQLRKIEGKSNFRKGAVIGLVAGGLIGGVVGVATFDSGDSPREIEEAVTVLGSISRGRAGAILGGLGGLIAGGVIGSQFKSERVRVYTFSDDTQTKSVEIRAVLANK